jgi:hypothetical protein
MRSFLILASVAAAFAIVQTTDANAVVCAAGVLRAGCAGVRGAVVRETIRVWRLASLRNASIPWPL